MAASPLDGLVVVRSGRACQRPAGPLFMRVPAQIAFLNDCDDELRYAVSRTLANHVVQWSTAILFYEIGKIIYAIWSAVSG